MKNKMAHNVFEEPEKEQLSYLNCHFCGKRLGRFLHEEEAYAIATACWDCKEKWKNKFERRKAIPPMAKAMGILANKL